MKLNLGCGSQVPDGWVNVDYSFGARIAKTPLFHRLNKIFRIVNLEWDDKIYIHDLTKIFPWGDSTVDIIYCSHTLEHFTKQEGRRFLTECHRILRKNGIFRIVVPDIRHIVNEYTEGRIHADDFIEKLGVLYGNSKSGIKGRLSTFFHFPHKCMYDTEILIEILSKLGFEAESKTTFDSKISDIRRIELEGRTENAVVVEGRKY